MSLSTGRPAMTRALAFLAVAERLDFLGQAVLFLDGDPFEHLDALLERLDLLAQAAGFLRVLGAAAAHLAHRPDRNAHLVPDDGEHEHHQQDGEYELEGVHWDFSSTGMRAWSRNASIWAAVWAPPSVTICSTTRSRASNRSICCAYCALFSAARSLCARICFSLTRSHILNGAMPIAARGMRTQIQLAMLFIPERPFVSSQIYRRSSWRFNRPCRHSGWAALRPPTRRTGVRSASICAAVWAPPSVTICSRMRTRCSSSIERDAYCAAFSAAMPASISSFFSRNLKKRLAINIRNTVGKPTIIAARKIAVTPCITHSLPFRSPARRSRGRATGFRWS